MRFPLAKFKRLFHIPNGIYSVLVSKQDFAVGAVVQLCSAPVSPHGKPVGHRLAHHPRGEPLLQHRPLRKRLPPGICRLLHRTCVYIKCHHFVRFRSWSRDISIVTFVGDIRLCGPRVCTWHRCRWVGGTDPVVGEAHGVQGVPGEGCEEAHPVVVVEAIGTEVPCVCFPVYLTIGVLRPTDAPAILA